MGGVLIHVFELRAYLPGVIISFKSIELNIVIGDESKNELPFSEVTRQKKMQQNTTKHKMNML